MGASIAKPVKDQQNQVVPSEVPRLGHQPGKLFVQGLLMASRVHDLVAKIEENERGSLFVVRPRLSEGMERGHPRLVQLVRDRSRAASRANREPAGPSSSYAFLEMPASTLRRRPHQVFERRGRGHDALLKEASCGREDCAAQEESRREALLRLDVSADHETQEFLQLPLPLTRPPRHGSGRACRALARSPLLPDPAAIGSESHGHGGETHLPMANDSPRWSASRTGFTSDGRKLEPSVRRISLTCVTPKVPSA